MAAEFTLDASPTANAGRHSLADFARAVSEAADVDTARRTAVRLAAQSLGASGAALTRQGEPRTVIVATSRDVAVAITGVAASIEQGICWQVHRDGVPVLSPDLRSERRWPGYCGTLLEQTSIRSVAGLPLRFTDQLLGALLLYSDRPGYFAGPVLARALALADHAAMALAHAEDRVKLTNLEVALRTNREIAIAIGIIMNRFRVTEEQAFELLRQVSQEQHTKVRDLATGVVLTGEIPAPRSARNSRSGSVVR
jgi:GAF domain-containing protein